MLNRWKVAFAMLVLAEVATAGFFILRPYGRYFHAEAQIVSPGDLPASPAAFALRCPSVVTRAPHNATRSNGERIFDTQDCRAGRHRRRQLLAADFAAGVLGLVVLLTAVRPRIDRRHRLEKDLL